MILNNNLEEIRPDPGAIVKSKAETDLVDILDGCSRWEIKVHDHGLVALVDVMPRLVPKGRTADFAVAQAARVSYGDGTKQITEDRGLIRYLQRHRHTTPTEMVEFKFHHVMPIFVARQWIRHRTANVNEYSARYSIVKDRFYRPSKEYLCKQSATNKQGREGVLEDKTANEFLEYLDDAEALYERYEELTNNGVARELARIGLPASTYTEWYWKIDLHNLLHFLALRADSHAQQEIQDYANAMIRLIEPIVPVTMEAWNDYHPMRGAITLTRLEINALSGITETGGFEGIKTDNKREQQEWIEKYQRIFGAI